MLSKKDIADKYHKFKRDKINKIDDLINSDEKCIADNKEADPSTQNLVDPLNPAVKHQMQHDSSTLIQNLTNAEVMSVLNEEIVNKDLIQLLNVNNQIYVTG